MPLIGTISGSIGSAGALRSQNAITGTLVIANVTTSFPTIATDTVLFVSGNINGTVSKSVFGGDVVSSGSVIIKSLSGGDVITLGTDGNVTGSNILANGDLDVRGGDITTNQTTFNLLNTTATTVNFAGAATALTIGGTGVNAYTQIRNVLTASDVVVIDGASTADVVTTKTTANLFNTVATTVNFAGGATALAMGAATGQTTIGNELNVNRGVFFNTRDSNISGGSITSDDSDTFMTLGTTTGNGTLTLHAPANDGMLLIVRKRSNANNLTITGSSGIVLVDSTNASVGAITVTGGTQVNRVLMFRANTWWEIVRV